MKRMTVLLLTLILLILPACQARVQEESASLDCDRAFTHLLRQFCATEDAFYFGDGNRLYYVDRTTGICAPLCGKPECGHKDESCNAYYPKPLTGIANYDGRLYMMRSHDTVYSVAYDGTDRREVMTLSRDLIPDNWSYVQYLMHRGHIYFSCTTGDVENGEPVYRFRICAFPLDAEGDGFVIYEGDAGDSFSTPAIQPYGDGLYILLSHYDASGGAQHGFSVKRWDTQTRELENLYEAVGVPFNYVVDMWVMDDGIVFQGFIDEERETKVYKFDFERGEPELLFTAAPASTRIYAKVGISDHVVAGTGRSDESGAVPILIKDFEGNILAEESYTPDLPDGVSSIGMDFFGADELQAYFYVSSGISDDSGKTVGVYTAIVAVPLDGSGAYVLSEEY